jgi:L-seryl-tRNA(Ser) seleniumtransferase
VNGSIYEKLGIRPVVNGMGTYTALGGSLMPPEVLAAMAEAARHFVDIPELQAKVGARIASLVGVPAAMVTAGAASAITVATAACMARGRPDALHRLPDTEGLPGVVIVQKAHRSGYEPQILLTGAELVWVETRDELDRAIGDRTAMLFFLNRHEPDGRIGRGEWIRVGRERGVPTVNDAAADSPPARRLSQYVDEGFDLVAFSGGKGLRGPQSTGLLLGRSDLVAIARQAISPHEGIGRGMKVGKEELAGVLAAVERFVGLDHDAERRRWEEQADAIVARLGGIAGMNARRDVPPIANHAPHVVLEWSAWHAQPTAAEVARRLRAGDPPIAVLVEGERALRVAVWTLQGDEHRIVAERLAQVFRERS